MKKGGYQIIDLHDVEITLGEGVIFDGVYDLIEGTRKTILISGLNIGGTEKKDLYANFVVSGSDYVANVGGLTITVNSNDKVLITEFEDENAPYIIDYGGRTLTEGAVEAGTPYEQVLAGKTIIMKNFKIDSTLFKSAIIFTASDSYGGFKGKIFSPISSIKNEFDIQEDFWAFTTDTD